MKPVLRLLIVLLTVLASSNSRVFAASVEHPQSSAIDLRIDNETTLLPDESIQDREYAYERAEEGDYCKIKLPCAMAGGSCVTDPDDCRHGRLIPDGCRGKLCQCCVKDCREENGFFRLPSSPQCFKLMTDSPNLTWTEAQALCEKHHLKLAHPWNSIELRRYILQRYGTKQAFVNAKGNGQNFVWQDNDEVIANGNPLWLLESGRLSPTTSRCVIINFEPDFNTKPWQPFWPTDIATRLDYRLPLCEVVYE